MNEWTSHREQDYRRRILCAIPIAAAVVGLLVIVSDHVSFQEIERYIGWKGEMQLMPEITIIPDDDPTNIQERERKLASMSTIDLDLPEGTDISGPEFVNVERPEEEQLDFAEFDEFRVHTVEKHADVPYSRDFVILKMVEPVYPEQAREHGVEGSVLVELLVGETGHVEQASILSRFGPVSFEESSLIAVRQFEFQPPVENGKPSSMWIKFVIRFRMYS